MEQDIKVSVVMPSLNVQPYIRECMDSVVNQTLKDMEIICVDAGSTDGTLEILQAYAEKDKRIQVIISDKRSYGYQMNIGITTARGEYIGIVETDDYIAANMYEELYSLAKEHHVDIIKADFKRFVDQDGKRLFYQGHIANEKNLYQRVINPAKEFQIFNTFGFSWAGLVKKSFLLDNEIEHHESPGASFQDNGFFIQTYFFAKRIYFSKNSYYYLRRDNPNSSSNSTRGMMMLEEYEFITKKLKRYPQIYEKFKYIYAVLRMKNYLFAIERMPNDQKKEFIDQFSKEFNKLKVAGELDEKLFTSRWEEICEIIDTPENYFILHHFRPEQCCSPDDASQAVYLYRINRLIALKLEGLQNSIEYRIGSIIIWPWRKINGGIKCLRDHGLDYTIRRIIEHFGIPMNAEMSRNQDKDIWR